MFSPHAQLHEAQLPVTGGQRHHIEVPRPKVKPGALVRSLSFTRRKSKTAPPATINLLLVRVVGGEKPPLQAVQELAAHLSRVADGEDGATAFAQCARHRLLEHLLHPLLRTSGWFVAHDGLGCWRVA